MTRYVVRLCDGVWIAPWTGDPGRTLVLQNAEIFDSKREASRALGRARRFGRPFDKARVVALQPKCLIEEKDMITNADFREALTGLFEHRKMSRMAWVDSTYVEMLPEDKEAGPSSRFVLKLPGGDGIANQTWRPSATDMVAEDWYEVVFDESLLTQPEPTEEL